VEGRGRQGKGRTAGGMPAARFAGMSMSACAGTVCSPRAGRKRRQEVQFVVQQRTATRIFINRNGSIRRVTGQEQKVVGARRKECMVEGNLNKISRPQRRRAVVRAKKKRETKVCRCVCVNSARMGGAQRVRVKAFFRLQRAKKAR